MARTFPTAFPTPDLQFVSPRENITAAQLLPLVSGLNWLAAKGPVVVSQAWHRNDIPLARTSAVYGAANASWRIPFVDGLTTVTATVRASRLGAAGAIRFTGATAGVAVTTALAAAGEQWVTTAPITVASTALAPEVLEMRIVGDGAAATVIHEVHVEYTQLTSPLAATLGAFTGCDVDEVAADAPIAADLLRYVFDNLAAIRDRVHVRLAWSGLADVDDGTVGTVYAPPWPHRVWCPVHPGGRDAGVTMRVWYRAQNVSGATEYLTIHHGGGRVEGSGADHRTRIAIPGPAGAVKDTYEDVVLSEVRSIPGLPYDLASVSVYPAGFGGFSDGSGSPARTTCSLRRLSAWMV